MNNLRDAARQALESLQELNGWQSLAPPATSKAALEAAINLSAALVEDAMQKFTDVNQELEVALAEPVQDSKHATIAEWWADKQCPNCVSLQDQNTELDRKLAELQDAVMRGNGVS